MSCPRCGAPEKWLAVDLDPDCRYCRKCNHTVFIGVRVEPLPPSPIRDDYSEGRKCHDCGTEITNDSSRCAPCAAKRNGKRVKAKSKPIVLSPRREGNYVAPLKARVI